MVFFVALLATAMALGAALAHAFELPNKIGLPEDEYFIMQKAYRGWNQLAFLLVTELASMIALAALYWNEPHVRWPVVVAIFCLLGAQAIFWLYTYPTNVSTNDWTMTPGNWEELRNQWEYSHLAGAGFQLAAMSFLIVAALSRR